MGDPKGQLKNKQKIFNTFGIMNGLDFVDCGSFYLSQFQPPPPLSGGPALDTLEKVGHKRMLAKLTATMGRPSSRRPIRPRCKEEELSPLLPADCRLSKERESGS